MEDYSYINNKSDKTIESKGTVLFPPLFGMRHVGSVIPVIHLVLRSVYHKQKCPNNYCTPKSLWIVFAIKQEKRSMCL